MEGRIRIRRSVRQIIVGVLSLALPALARADLTNTAQVSYRDGSGTTRAGASNTVTVVVSAGALPAPDLSGINGHAYTLVDDVAFNYPISGVSFQWTLTAVQGLGVRHQALGIGTNSYNLTPNTYSLSPNASGASAIATTSVPRFSLATQTNLTPGTYSLSVAITQGTQSTSAGATINLVAADLSAVRVFPNPWRADRHSGRNITFDTLPANATITLFTVSGHLVKTLGAQGSGLGTGTLTWDRTNDSGDTVASGLYLYLLKTPDGQTARGKFAIIR